MIPGFTDSDIRIVGYGLLHLITSQLLNLHRYTHRYIDDRYTVWVAVSVVHQTESYSITPT